MLDRILAEIQPHISISDTPRRHRTSPAANPIYKDYDVGDIAFQPAKPSTIPPIPTPAPSTTSRSARSHKPTTADLGLGPPLPGSINKMVSIIQQLLKHPWCYPFAVPVDPVALNIPDYFQVIKNPMDLGTIKSQIQTGHYSSPDEVADDIRLVWNNAKTYNAQGSEVHAMAAKLSDIFEDLFNNMKAPPAPSLESRMPLRSIAELKEAIKYVQAEITQVKRDKRAREKLIVGTAFPKARAAPKPQVEVREMTWAEKAQLTAAINEMDEEHLASVVNIIQQRNPQLAENAESELIEIDLEAVDNGTLRALERFVNTVNRKKHKPTKTPTTRERHHSGPQDKQVKLEQLAKRYAELGGDQSAKKEEEEVDIGENLPNEYPPVTIEKDRSSSSSSSDITSSDSSDGEMGDIGLVEPGQPADAEPPAPTHAEEAKPVVANLSAWSKLEAKAADSNVVASDPLWSEFKNKEQQTRQREKEREEQEEAARLARQQAEEERKQREEQQRLEKIEAEQKQREQEAEEEIRNQRQLAEKREAARKAREQAQKDVDLNAQRVDMEQFLKGN